MTGEEYTKIKKDLEGSTIDFPIIDEVLDIMNRYIKEPKTDILDKRIKSELNRIKDEQEPCEDCISRAELLKAIDTWDKFGCDADTKLVPYKDHYIPYIHYDDVVKCIKGMPSVQLKTGEDIHIKAIKNNLNRMVDKLDDDTDYYDCIYHLEQLEKEQKNMLPTIMIERWSKSQKQGNGGMI